MSAISSLAALFSAVALYATYLGSGDAKWSVYKRLDLPGKKTLKTV